MARNLLRTGTGETYARVAFIELFFDLVFVFAITQLSHMLLAHYTMRAALESTMLMLAVWWVWIYSTWVLNWLDPRTMPVRVLLFALMLVGLFMSMAIPHAFEERGLVFALAYVAGQVGRSFFAARAMGSAAPALSRNFTRIGIWMAVSGVFWIAGGFAEHDARLALWLVALAIEYVGPWFGFRVPRLGASSTADWTVLGEHMAERCGLFIILALGETLLVSGATFGAGDWSGVEACTFVVAFVSTVAMWWNYFHIGHGRAAHLIEHSADPGRIARAAFTYAHIPIVGGIILAAVGSELVLAHPRGHTDLGMMAAIVGGPALFLGGVLWFKKLTWDHAPFSHLLGLGLMALLAIFGTHFEPAVLATLVTATQVLVAAWENVSIGGTRYD